MAGALLLALTATAVHAGSQIDLIGPPGSAEFGAHVVVLPNGNIVVADPTFDDGALAEVGAVSLYDGGSMALISRLTGSMANDQVGSDGIVLLTNGNYVVRSPKWDNGAIVDAGAVTWGSQVTGVSGTISEANSLVGGKANDKIGAGGVTALTNGNYVVASPEWSGARTYVGAVTWGNGATGTTGYVSADNSIVGSIANDKIGSEGVTALANGNYVIASKSWDNISAPNAGAVTWGNGSGVSSGAVSAANSLVGSTTADQVGFSGVTALSNGNYVVRSFNWDNGPLANAGAVTWGSGTTGIAGAISASNSLIGSTADDKVGYSGVTPLANGNYVVRSQNWDNGSEVDAGAVTWGDGATGITGTVTITNSLVGSSANDQVGFGAVTSLVDGSFVATSPYWDNGAVLDAGAATWGKAAGGATGSVTLTNSLVGSATNDRVGLGGATALTNGNYVVVSYGWNNDPITNTGAVTWGSGAHGITGTVTATNSLIGSTSNDQAGLGGVTALTNGNYVVRSPAWDNGSEVDAGAATWGNGTAGSAGAITAANSLVGSKAGDRIASSAVTALADGNYVVASRYWDGAATDAGAATWGNGVTGIAGPVAASNSLVGAKNSDQIGDGGVVALDGGYAVVSRLWDGAGVDSGAVTWGDSTTGLTGTISAANSLVGNRTDDQLGSGGVTALPGGGYLVVSPKWNNGTRADAGAVTLAESHGVTVGPISSANSVLGTTAGGGSSLIYSVDATHARVAVGRPDDKKVTLINNLVMLVKSVTPASAGAGEIITYTLAFTNTSAFTLTQLLITDVVPIGQVEGVSFTASVGVAEIGVRPLYAWAVQDLPPGAAGTIALQAMLTGTVNTGDIFTNTVTLAAGGAMLATSQAPVSVRCPEFYLVRTTADAGHGSLRRALADTCTGGTVAFDAALDGQKIVLSSGELVIARVLTIDGPGAHLLAVDGAQASRVFSITASGVAIEGLTLQNGGTAGAGGGLFASANLVLTDVAVLSSTAGSGGGVYIAGNGSIWNGRFAANQCTQSGCAGGGLAAASLAMTGAVVADNGAATGGGVEIFGAGGATRLVNTVFTGNYAGQGEALRIAAPATVTILNSTILGGPGAEGSAIWVAAGNVGITNTIVASYSVGIGHTGGTVWQDYNLFQVATLATGSVGGGAHSLAGAPILGPPGDYGGRVLSQPLLPGSPAIDAGTLAGCPPTDQRGIARAAACDIGAYEARPFVLVYLAGDGQQTGVDMPFGAPLMVGVTATGGDPVDGGYVTVFGPMSGASLAPITNTATISGGIAFFSIAANSEPGSYQVAATARGAGPTIFFSLANLPPSLHLAKFVTPGAARPGEPITYTLVFSNSGHAIARGVRLTDTIPVSVTAVTVTGTIAFQDSGLLPQYVWLLPELAPGGTGIITVTAIISPHVIPGVFTNTATIGTWTRGDDPADNESSVPFTVLCPNPYYVVTTADEGAGSLRQAIVDTCVGGTVTFDPVMAGKTITLTNGPIFIQNEMTIDGASLDVTLSGNQETRVLYVREPLVLKALTVADGARASGGGGGLYNDESSVTLVDVVFRDHRALYGAALYNFAGQVTIQGGAFISNSASAASAGAGGGGIYNDEGDVVLAGVTFKDNRAHYGGALCNFDGTVDVTNSTFTGNRAIVASANDGGGAIYNRTILTVTHSTFVDNIADPRTGAGIQNIGTATVRNSVMARSTYGSNCGGAPFMSGSLGNFADDATCGASSEVIPAGLVATSGRFGGRNETVPLLLGSPAIDGAATAYCPPADQREIPRAQGAACDAGAFESQGFTITMAGGNHQSTPAGMAFVWPLSVTVSSAYSEPVDGGRVTFLAGLAGASAAFAPAATSSISNATAILPVLANRIVGSYSITATGVGLAPAVSWTLTNTAQPIGMTLASTPNPSLPDTTITFRAEVGKEQRALAERYGLILPPPTGIVTFTTNGDVVLGIAALSNGLVNISSDMEMGTHVITATYGGDEQYPTGASAVHLHKVQPPPIARNDATGVQQGGNTRIDVVANDLNAGDGLIVESASQPAHGIAVVDADGKTVIYTPDPAFTGVDSFHYVVRHANSGTDQAEVTVIVSNASLTDQAPQIWPIDPRMGSRSTFTSNYVTIQTEALAGAYNGTLGDKDIFYLAYTQVTTPTSDIRQQPGGLIFGNYVFDLTAYVNGAPFERFYFGQPVTLTVTYDPAVLGEMDDELLTLLFWDGTEWSDKGIQSVARDRTARRLTVVISHLSEYAFFTSAQPQHLHLPAISHIIPPEPGLQGNAVPEDVPLQPEATLATPMTPSPEMPPLQEMTLITGSTPVPESTVPLEGPVTPEGTPTPETPVADEEVAPPAETSTAPLPAPAETLPELSQPPATVPPLPLESWAFQLYMPEVGR